MQNTEIVIQRVGLEGQGVGYDAQGNIYFVPGAIPGDSVRIEYEEAVKKYRDASLIEVTSPSGERVNPPCAYFGECGGCDFLHWDYASQLKAKLGILKHGIERAGWPTTEVRDFFPSPKISGYRNRIQIRREGAKVGFYKKRSHDIVDIEKCYIADERLNEKLSKLRLDGSVAEKEKLELAITTSGDVSVVRNRMHGALGFQQINAEQNLNLQNLVRSKVKEQGAKRVLELYCGDGNLTFAYEQEVERVFGFDSSKPAIDLARQKRKNEMKTAFFADNVNPSLPRKLPADFRNNYDTLIVDPPRSGMEGGIKPFLHPGLKTIIYVSCSIVAFSRDLHAIKKEFQLREVQPLDMFPHTRHIESVSLFTRS